jgi:hypothetical protein
VSRADPPRAVLDVDIVYSRVLHELMGRAARRPRLLDLFWSEELISEAKQSLVEKKDLSSDGQTSSTTHPFIHPAGHDPNRRISLDGERISLA